MKTYYKINEANILKRFLSFIIDYLILSCIVTAIVFFSIKDEFFKYTQEKKNVKVEKTTTIDYKEDYLFIKNTFSKNKKLQYSIIVVNFAYYVIFWLYSKQATIGQQIFNLVVVKNNGEKINFYDAVNRACAFYLLKLTFITIFFHEKRETLYDILTRTKVLEVK